MPINRRQEGHELLANRRQGQEGLRALISVDDCILDGGHIECMGHVNAVRPVYSDGHREAGWIVDLDPYVFSAFFEHNVANL